MTLNSRNSQPFLTEDDYILLKELVGSAMYFTFIREYSAMVEEKLTTNTSWDIVRIVELDTRKDYFINWQTFHEEGPAREDYYPLTSPVIQRIKDSTGAYLRILEEKQEDLYEKKLLQDGIKVVCLCPIIMREQFAGMLTGYKRSTAEITRRDQKLLEVSAEIIALALEIFKSNQITEDLTRKVEKFQKKLINLESLKIMGDLAASTAHSLNNLLAGILGYIQIIEMKTTDQDIKHNLEIMREAALAGRESIKNLQEFRKMDLEMEFDLVRINEVLKRAVQLTRAKWQDEAWAKSIEYKIEMDTRDDLLVIGNNSTLLESFIIIIVKALESIPNGGKISITTRAEKDHAEIKFVAAREPSIRSSIADLDPFMQLRQDAEISLDLKVAQDIIRKHHGSINVESKIGQGTVIDVKIPVMARKIEEIKEHAESFEKVSAHVLVVEDEPIVRTLLKDVLTAEGFQVTTAEGGEQALKIMGDKQFDVVITDLGMPVMSGFDLSDRIRKDYGDIPIILATGWESQIDRKKVEKYNIDYVVGKPFQFKELLDAIVTSVTSAKSE